MTNAGFEARANAAAEEAMKGAEAKEVAPVSAWRTKQSSLLTFNPHYPGRVLWQL